ncbi:beta-lactamase class A [Pedobacter cryoconitis]|uniref:beta-lactamase n=1 Tax=Pedobacter cryoconitis TaxID=188932 RepID=A0A7W8YRQ3_9SPHI|nr:class A beta-lactamase, subclass A2 [Pedobacter cryoconitis]MBB5620432.1 beta-lactamase class A [Pedobacter cryoconitis]
MKGFITLKKMIIAGLLLTISVNGFAQKNELRKKLQAIVSSHAATIGFSLTDLQNGDTITVNGTKHLPMQSVYKFHLALAILNQVDKGKLKLDQKILIKKSDLLPNTWSPLRDKYPNGEVEIPLSEILSYTVSQSDNNGCDILFRLMGGPSKVNQYIHSLGIKQVAIVATEEQMHQDENVQFTNWTTPVAATDLLKLFYSQKVLSKTSYDFLWKVMTETVTGANKLKGLLPAGTLVAHKTGNSGANAAGLTAATNDIGIVTLPNGKHFAVAVFVSMTKEDEKATDLTIAELTKASWDYLTAEKL